MSDADADEPPGAVAFTVAVFVTMPAFCSDSRTVCDAVQVIVCPGVNEARGREGEHEMMFAFVSLIDAFVNVAVPVFVATSVYWMTSPAACDDVVAVVFERVTAA